VPLAAVLLDRLARARDDLRLPLLGQLGVEHEQDLVVGHAPDSSLPSVLGGLAGWRRSGANDAVARQEGGQWSLGRVKAPTAWVAGAAGAAIAVWRRFRPAPETPAPVEDPRAEELRQKLEESRTVAEEQHEEAASAETPVDQVVDADASVEDRRAAVHE